MSSRLDTIHALACNGRPDRHADMLPYYIAGVASDMNIKLTLALVLYELKYTAISAVP